jgi:hypothetical protein
VSGKYPLLVQGVNLGANGEIHPRTAIGYSQDKRHLILMTIDGRQPGNIDCAADAHTAAWMLRFGAYDAVNLDGGGSTTMGVCNGQGGATELNRPIQKTFPVWNGPWPTTPAFMPFPSPAATIILRQSKGGRTQLLTFPGAGSTFSTIFSFYQDV